MDKDFYISQEQMSLKNQELWEWLEKKCQDITYGEMDVSLKIQDGVPIHADVISKRESYRSDQKKRKESII